MNWQQKAYDAIPGTYIFDGKRAHPAYAINKLLFSFNTQENRDDFDQNPAAYCDKYNVKDAYKAAVLNEDFLTLLKLGANIYLLAKMAIPRGVTIQDAGAQFQGITTVEFKENLHKRAENLQSIISNRGDYWNG